MTPLPKRKHSKGRRDRRRAHDALQARNTMACANCSYYKGREVVYMEKE